MFDLSEVQNTWKQIIQKVIKPHVQLPSRNKRGTIDASQPSLHFGPINEDVSFLKGLLKHNKGQFNKHISKLILLLGTIDLPPETILSLYYGQTNFHNLDGAPSFALKVFLYNFRFTVVSPESFFGPLDLKCPTCKKCDREEPLRFWKHGFDRPKLCMGMFEDNEVLIPMVYKCRKGHTLNTLQPEFLSQLPGHIAVNYHFLTTGGRAKFVYNSRCCEVLMSIEHGLSKVHSMVKHQKIYDFARRVEHYLFFVMQSRILCNVEWPTPPDNWVKSGSGGVSEFFCIPEQVLRDIRQSGYKEHRDVFIKDLQITAPGDLIALDWCYKVAKVARSALGNILIGCSKSGPDKGRIFMYSAHMGGESHRKSNLVYQGLGSRFDKKDEIVKAAIIDSCCNNMHPERLENNEHPTSTHMNLKMPPKADPFHGIVGVTAETFDCERSEEFRADVHKIIFNDLSIYLNNIPEVWLDVYEFIKKDGSIDGHVYDDPGLLPKKLIAYSTCFEDDLDQLEFPKGGALTRAKKIALLTLAIKTCSGRYCPYVPQTFRTKEGMKQELQAFVQKWLNCTIVPSERAPFAKFEFQSNYEDSEFTTELNLRQDVKQKQLYRNGTNEFVVLKKGGEDFEDANGVIWRARASKSFGTAKAFRSGSDLKILGKLALPNSVLNFAKHIFNGCFDYEIFKDSLYQDGPTVKGNSKFKSLVKVETSAGQNSVENAIKHLNLVKDGVSSYSDEECETRSSISILHRNYNTDVGHNLDVAPTPHLWVWQKLNKLSQSALAKKIFNFRTLGVDLEPENFLGFGSFRYEKLMANNDPAAKEKCAIFKLPKSTTFRWTKSLENSTSFGSSRITDSLKPVQKKASKRGMNDQRVYWPRKKIMVSNSSYIARTLSVEDKINTEDQRKTLNKAIAEVVLEAPKPRDIANLVARRFNEKTLENTSNVGPLESQKKSLPTLISVQGAAQALKRKAQAMQTIPRQPKKKKRGHQAHKDRPEQYPLTLDMIVNESFSMEDGKKYFSKLKNWYDKQLNTREKLSRDFKGLTRNKKAIYHGIRLIFAAKRLECVEYDKSQDKIIPRHTDKKLIYEMKASNDVVCVPSKHTDPGKVSYRLE